MKINRFFFILTMAFILSLVITFFYFNNPTPFKIIAKSEIKNKNKEIESLKNIIKYYKPKIIYKERKDSLKTILDTFKPFNYETKINIYNSSNIDGKFLLLSNEIQKDTIK